MGHLIMCRMSIAIVALMLFVSPALADYWVFVAANAISASTALSAANAAVSHDTLFNGQNSPVQYTRCWDNGIITLTDGRLAFNKKPGMADPSGLSTTLTPTAIQTLLPGTLPAAC